MTTEMQLGFQGNNKGDLKRLIWNTQDNGLHPSKYPASKLARKQSYSSPHLCPPAPANPYCCRWGWKHALGPGLLKEPKEFTANKPIPVYTHGLVLTAGSLVEIPISGLLALFSHCFDLRDTSSPVIQSWQGVHAAAPFQERTMHELNLHSQKSLSNNSPILRGH